MHPSGTGKAAGQAVQVCSSAVWDVLSDEILEVRLHGTGLLKSSGMFWKLQEGYLLLRAIISLALLGVGYLALNFFGVASSGRSFPWATPGWEHLKEGLGSLCKAHPRDTPAQMVVIQPVLPILVTRKKLLGLVMHLVQPSPSSFFSDT